MSYPFINSSYRVARKQHQCEACQSIINIGEKCMYEVGKFDGQFFDRYYHIGCYGVMQDFWSDCAFDNDDGFSYDEVRDWWYEGHCYYCKHFEENDGNCDRNMDKKIWCTRFEKRENK